MKTMILVVCLIILTAHIALASQTVTVEWGYDPPSTPAVTGYQLYQNGIARIIWPGAATVEGMLP